jgi:hypothetical protein
MNNPTVSLGKIDSIKEKGEKTLPLFMKEGKHLVKLIGQGTWGKTNSACVLTDKGQIGAYQLIDRLDKDDNLDQFTVDGEFVFEVGTAINIVIANKAVVETSIPSDETEEEDAAPVAEAKPKRGKAKA